MTDLFSLSTALVIRTIHVASAVAVLGGAVVLAIRAGRSSVAEPWLASTSMRYERFFWLGIGLIVMTGIGNAGAFGVALPPPNSRWGLMFSLKLAAVMSFLAFSFLRTLLVAHFTENMATVPRSYRTLALRYYAGTVGFAAAILAWALFLAHG